MPEQPYYLDMGKKELPIYSMSGMKEIPMPSTVFPQSDIGLCSLLDRGADIGVQDIQSIREEFCSLGVETKYESSRVPARVPAGISHV